MFCENCGTQVKENMKFCPNCGNQITQGQNRKKEETAKKNKYIGILTISVLAIVVIVLVFNVAGVFGGYEKVIKKYVKAIQEEDGQLLCSIYAPEYIDYMTGSGSFFSNEEELAEEFTEECKEKHEDLSGGVENHPDIKYDIISEEKIDEEDLESLNDDLEDWYDFENDSVSEAYYVTFKVYIPGGDVYRVERYMLKIHGRWYMGRGM